jgi:hypothetical protein
MKRASFLFTALFLTAPTVAAEPRIYTPKPGTTERAALLNSIRDDGGFDLKVKTLRVFRRKGRFIAYIHAEGPIGFGQTILTRSGNGPWVSVWGEGDGGSHSCDDGAKHYAWAMARIRSYGIDPNALFPGVSKRHREIAHEARVSPGTHCVGDLEGGPGRQED